VVVVVTVPDWRGASFRPPLTPDIGTFTFPQNGRTGMRRSRRWLAVVVALLLPVTGFAQRPTAQLRQFPTEQQGTVNES